MNHLAVLLTVAAVMTVSVCADSDSHNLIVGRHAFGETLVQKLVVQEHWSWLRVVEKQVTLTGDGLSVITMLKVTDQATNGKGGQAFLVGGGPGHTWATLQFQSQKSNSIDFVVEMFGRNDRPKY